MPRPTLDAIVQQAHDRAAALVDGARDLERRAALVPAPPPFQRVLAGATVGVIAEVKRRSPTVGPIRTDLDPVRHAQAYAR